MLFTPVGGSSFSLIQRDITNPPAAATGTAGVAVTPGTGAEGAWATLFAATSAPSYGIWIMPNGNNGSAAVRTTLVDVGIGAAGSEVVLINNLMAGGCISYTLGVTDIYFFPVYIPAGVRIAVRAQGSVATAFRVTGRLASRPMTPGTWKYGSYIDTYGVSGTTGTAINAGLQANGTWTQIGTLSRRAWWWQLGMQVGSGTAWTGASIHVDMAVGSSTSALDVIINKQHFVTTTTEQLHSGGESLGIQRSVPAGTNIYARANTGGAAADVYHAVVYALGG